MTFKSTMVKSALALTLAASAFAAAAPANASKVTYPDLKESKYYYNAVIALTDAGIINGLPDGTFGADKTISRAAAALIIAQSLPGYDTYVPTNPGFEDVKESFYAYKAIAFLKDQGIVKGISATKFGARDAISRGAVARILAEAYNLKTVDNKTALKDIKGNRFEQDIKALEDAGLAQGDTNKKYNPTKSISRGALATLAYNAINTFPSNYADVKENLIPTLFTTLEASNDGSIFDLTGDVENNAFEVEVFNGEITRAELEDYAIDLVKQAKGAGITVALKNVEINGVAYNADTSLNDLDALVENFGKAVGVSAADITALKNAGDNAKVFELLSDTEYEGKITLNYKDGESVDIDLKLVLALVQ